MKIISVAIADDHELIRVGLRSILAEQPDLEFVCEAKTGREAVSLCRKYKPDILVLDFSLPEMDGLEVTKHIVAANIRTKVLILTMHDNIEYAARAIKAGAYGFMVKGASSDELPEAIRKIAGGGTWLSASISEKLIFSQFHSKAEAVAGGLSDRELQVLKQLAAGKTLSEIADDLGISMKTVETYKSRMLVKLNLRNVADLTRFAIRHGLVE